MVMRLWGLKTSMRSRRSMKCGGKSLRIDLDWETLQAILDYLSIERTTSDYRLLISYYEGYPVNSNIFYICSTVELPGNNGFCAMIS
jgi:hypothetical protein